MYDLDNKYDKYNLLEHCLLDIPIDFYGLKIYCPKLEEIINIKEQEYTKLLSSILCDVSFYVGSNLLDDKVDILTYILYQNKESLFKNSNSITIFSVLKEALSFFFKIPISEIKECVNNSIIIFHNDRSMILDINKFKEFRNIICEITNSRIYTYLDLKEDAENRRYSSDEMMNERIKRFEIAKKRNQKENKEKENKIVELYNVISFVSNYKGYDVVKKYNIYQLINSYEFISADISFKFDLRIASSGYAGKDFKIKDIREILAK